MKYTIGNINERPFTTYFMCTSMLPRPQGYNLRRADPDR